MGCASLEYPPVPPLRSPLLPLGESARWSCVLLLVRVCVGCEEDCFPEKKNDFAVDAIRVCRRRGGGYV